MLIRPVGRRDRIAPELLALVGVMVAIELVLTLSDQGLLGPRGLRLIVFSYGAFWDPVLDGTVRPVFAAQPVTMFLTHAFLHGGLFHVAMNSVILLALGKFVSEQTGPWPMLGLFAVTAIGGGVGFALLTRTQVPMIGASGAVFGFLGLWQYWEAMARRARGMTLQPVLSTVAALVAANLVLAVLVSGALAWQAHLGGFLTGVAMGPWMTRIARQRHR